MPDGVVDRSPTNTAEGPMAIWGVTKEVDDEDTDRSNHLLIEKRIPSPPFHSKYLQQTPGSREVPGWTRS